MIKKYTPTPSHASKVSRRNALDKTQRATPTETQLPVVVLADDEDNATHALRALIEFAMEDNNFPSCVVRCCDNASSIAVLCKKERVAVVVSDSFLPHASLRNVKRKRDPAFDDMASSAFVTGTSALTSVKEISPNTTRIICSAHPDKSLNPAPGLAHYHFQKPVDAPELLAKIKLGIQDYHARIVSKDRIPSV